MSPEEFDAHGARLAALVGVSHEPEEEPQRYVAPDEDRDSEELWCRSL